MTFEKNLIKNNKNYPGFCMFHPTINKILIKSNIFDNNFMPEKPNIPYAKSNNNNNNNNREIYYYGIIC